MTFHDASPIPAEPVLHSYSSLTVPKDEPQGAAPVLVIKLGALGDFFMALPAMRALRAHHSDRPLHLLTIPGLAELAGASGLFDGIHEDPKGSWPLGHWRIARFIRRLECRRIYDLQGNRRTEWYFRLLGPRPPEWAGPAPGCAWPRPPRPQGAHRSTWYAAQLAALGIAVPPTADPVWLRADISALALPPAYCLVVAGGSAHRPGKRWPAGRYISLLRALPSEVVPVLLGTVVDAAANAEIARAFPSAIDMTGKTSLASIASLARKARFAVGNDTGPMHVIAATGCASVVLYSQESDPGFIAPLGARVACLQRSSLETLDAQEVLHAVQALCGMGME